METRYLKVGFALFYYTLLVLLATIMAAAACFSAYLVSHKRTLILASSAFLFYFFDVAWVLQDDFFSIGAGADFGGVYAVARSLASVVTGCGFLMSFWLLVCDYLGETRRNMLVLPGVAFVVGSIAMLVLLPESDLERFLFYGMREFMMFWMLLYAGYRYLTSKDEFERGRLRRHLRLYVVLWLLSLMVIMEDAVFFLIADPSHVVIWPRSFAPERNFSENILLLCCMFFACRDAYRVLSMRFERPPMHGGERQETLINDNLLVYAKRHQLSEREQEVLQLVLMGKDNQNIASSMQLALSTVKVHVHNILQKTGQPNRQALTQDFWKTS